MWLIASWFVLIISLATMIFTWIAGTLLTVPNPPNFEKRLVCTLLMIVQGVGGFFFMRAIANNCKRIEELKQEK
jgi:hypothetical protein